MFYLILSLMRSGYVLDRPESDFRLVAEYFRARRLGAEEQMRYNTRTIRHVEAMLEFLRTFARHERFEKIQEELVESAEKGRETSYEKSSIN